MILELLKFLGKNKEVDKLSTEVQSNCTDIKLEHRPEQETWESIVAQANVYELNPVYLEEYNASRRDC